jgi:hypothetical protein
MFEMGGGAVVCGRVTPEQEVPGSNIGQVTFSLAGVLEHNTYM